MSEAESPPAEPGGGLRRWRPRPAAVLAILAGLFLLLFPDLGGKELAFIVRLPAAECADELVVRVRQPDGALARQQRQLLDGVPQARSSFRLPRGAYALGVELACSRTGASVPARERHLELDQETEVEVDLRAACPCRPDPR